MAPTNGTLNGGVDHLVVVGFDHGTHCHRDTEHRGDTPFAVEVTATATVAPDFKGNIHSRRLDAELVPEAASYIFLNVSTIFGVEIINSCNARHRRPSPRGWLSSQYNTPFLQHGTQIPFQGAPLLFDMGWNRQHAEG
jgi:hypothetical protein